MSSEQPQTCNAETDRDSFGVYVICDETAGHDGNHRGWLIGNMKMTEWGWTEDGEEWRIR